MARGFERPPLWAVIAMVVGVIALVAGFGYAATQKTHDPLSAAEISREAAAESSAEAAHSRAVAASDPRNFNPATATVYGDFSTAPNGTTLGSAATGQRWTTTQNLAPGAAYRIVGGRLTNAATVAAPAAAYLEVGTPAPLKRVGAEFVLTSNAAKAAVDDKGGVMIGGWRDPIVGSFPKIPYSPAHFVITRTKWELGVWDAAKGLELLRTGTFTQPLADDGHTKHTAGIVFSGTTVVLLLPDGATATVSDPRIAQWASRWPCWEVYQPDASTDSRASFVRVWAVA